jgi:PglZ domain
MTISLRDMLADEIGGKVQRYGVVVWEDPRREYFAVAREIAPPEAEFAALNGSWYELLRRLERPLAAAEPGLVVYVDVEQPAESPLEEVAATGTRFTRRLRSLLRRTLEGQLPSGRIDEIAAAAGTLVEAESLLEAGGGAVPPALVRELGVSEPNDVVLGLAAGSGSLEEEVQRHAEHFLEAHVGLKTRSTDLPSEIARHLTLVELVDADVGIPERLTTALPSPTREQGRHALEILRRWRHDETHREAFRMAMRVAGEELTLDELAWSDGLISIDTVPQYEKVAFAEALRRIDEGLFGEGLALAEARAKSLWADAAYGASDWAQRWHALRALCDLRLRLERQDDMSGKLLPEQLGAYAATGWPADRAHRRLERAFLEVVDRTALDGPVRAARERHEEWMDAGIRDLTDALEREGLVTGTMLRQAAIHEELIGPLVQKEQPVVLFMVDALRLELGHELAESLKSQFDDPRVELRPAVGLLPSTTMLGMASLCPGADGALRVEMQGSKLNVTVSGELVRTPPERLGLMRAAYGRVADFRLDDVVRMHDDELQDALAEAALAVVRSQEIDEAAEAGKLAASFTAFDHIVGLISRAVARLAHRGVRAFVVTADHGFIALSHDLGPHMIIDKPGGTGVVHRRVFVGRGGAAGEELVRVPMDRLGLPGDLDVLMPRGLALIAHGGSRGFFHGGASPQELCIPVITLELEPTEGATLPTIEASISGKITSQIFTARLLLQPDLFGRLTTVRPVPVRVQDGAEVGVLVAAGGAEFGEGLVRLEPAQAIGIGFRVAARLRRGEEIVLRVLDGRTDVLLGSSPPATVGRDLEIDDELGID